MNPTLPKQVVSKGFSFARVRPNARDAGGCAFCEGLYALWVLFFGADLENSMYSPPHAACPAPCRRANCRIVGLPGMRRRALCKQLAREAK